MMTDDPSKGAFFNKVRALAAQAVPGPWNDLLSLKGGPRNLAVERASLELAHLAPELAKWMIEAPLQVRLAELEHENEELNAALVEAEAELENLEPDASLAEENDRLTNENDRLRAEVARLTAALNGTLVDGEPR